jgi:O-antigen/teichoic acid export membrane protein
VIKKLFSYASAEIIAKGLNWATIAILPLLIAPAEYGIVGIAVAVEGVLSMVLLVGQEKAILRFQEDSPTVVFKNAFKLVFLLFFIFFIICLPLAFIHRTVFGLHLYPDIFYLLIGLFFFNILKLMMAHARVEDNVKLFWGSRSIYQVIKLIGVVIVCYVTKSGLGYIYGVLIASVLTTLYYARFFKDKLDFKFNRAIMLSYWLFGWPFIFHSISGNILTFADRFFIEGYLNKSQLGIYTFTYTIGSSLTFLYVGVSVYFEPLAYKFAANKQMYSNILSIYEKALVFLGGFTSIFLLLAFRWYVGRYLNHGYMAGFNIIGIILAAYLLNPMYYSANYALTIINKTKFIALSTLIAGATNVISNFYFIPKFGIKGAAITTFISYLILMFISKGFYARLTQDKFNIRDIPFLNILFLLIIACSIICADNYLLLILLFAIVSMIALLSIYLDKDLMDIINKHFFRRKQVEI